MNEKTVFTINLIMSRGKANELAPMGIDETLSIVEKFEGIFLDFKDNKIEKLNVNKSSNGEYVAYAAEVGF